MLGIAASEVVDWITDAALLIFVLYAAGVIVWWGLIFLCSQINFVWFDLKVRRRLPGLRGAFLPKFVIEPFVAAGEQPALGASISSFITDEISQAEPSGTALRRVTADRSSNVADSLAETSSYLAVLRPLQARVLGMRRYTVRGSLHEPTEQWQSMTVEIVGRDSRVLANRTFYAKRLRDAPDDASESYLLVPLAAAWLVFTLHDVFRFPSDRQWRSRRIDHSRLTRWHRWLGRPDPLYLVGTPSWESYGHFRAGFWLETLEQFPQAKDEYIRALNVDRHNIGAVLNNIGLDQFEPARARLVRTRLDMARAKLHERSSLIVNHADAEELQLRITNRLSGLANELGDRGSAELVDSNSENRARIVEQLVRLGINPAPNSTSAANDTRRGFEFLSPLWFTWAYRDAVARLNEHVNDRDALGEDSGTNLARALDGIEHLVRLISLILLTYRDQHGQPLRLSDGPREFEAALVERCEQTEFTALSILASTLNEMDLAGYATVDAQTATETPDGYLRWAYLAAIRAGHRRHGLQPLLALIEPNRPVSYLARYNLACCYSRRAKHFARIHNWTPPTTPMKTFLARGWPHDVTAASLADPEELFRQGCINLQLAVENSHLRAQAGRDRSVRFIAEHCSVDISDAPDSEHEEPPQLFDISDTNTRREQPAHPHDNK